MCALGQGQELGVGILCLTAGRTELKARGTIRVEAFISARLLHFSFFPEQEIELTSPFFVPPKPKAWRAGS